MNDQPARPDNGVGPNQAEAEAERLRTDRAVDVLTPADLVAALRAAGEERDKLHKKELDELRRKLTARLSADRAVVYRELADQQTQLAVADDLARRRDLATARRQLVKELRRLADEADEPLAQAVTDVGAAIVDALTAKGAELSELAEEEMRPSLEERAQTWYEAAALAEKMARTPKEASGA